LRLGGGFRGFSAQEGSLSQVERDGGILYTKSVATACLLCRYLFRGFCSIRRAERNEPQGHGLQWWSFGANSFSELSIANDHPRTTPRPMGR
jgi:hypothetical protein